MARLSGIEPVTAAVIARLRADTGVTALVPAARLTNEVVPGTTRPYVVVSVESETDDDTLSLGGIDAVLSTLIVSQYTGDKEQGQIASAIRTALDGQTVTLAGFTAPADVSYEQALGAYKDEIAGVVVRHRPLWFRVRAV